MKGNIILEIIKSTDKEVRVVEDINADHEMSCMLILLLQEII